MAKQLFTWETTCDRCNRTQRYIGGHGDLPIGWEERWWSTPLGRGATPIVTTRNAEVCPSCLTAFDAEHKDAIALYRALRAEEVEKRWAEKEAKP